MERKEFVIAGNAYKLKPLTMRVQATVRLLTKDEPEKIFTDGDALNAFMRATYDGPDADFFDCDKYEVEAAINGFFSQLTAKTETSAE